jgi:diketogulonate reductase-like aldo/keto reductase
VSNFGVRHLEELLKGGTTVPVAVNQVEVHPFNTQTAITSYCHENGIVVEAYAPLVRGMRMKHPTIVKLARQYAVTPAQLLIRWGLQNDAD